MSGKDRISTAIALCVSFLLFMLHGCASTDVFTRLNKAYSGRVYLRILLYADLDFEYQEKLEVELRGRLQKKGTTSMMAHELFFPGTLEENAERTSQAVTDNDLDAILLIGLSDLGQGSSTGGLDTPEPWAWFHAELLDAETNESVWKADIKSRGLMYASWQTIVKSVAGGLTSRLKKDGRIR